MPTDSEILVAVIEDNPILMEIVQTALEDGGFTVATAGTGQAAIDLIEANGIRCRALVTDVDIGHPTVTGWDIARRARELKPEIPVVYMTGAQGDEWPVFGVPGSLLLTKPFAMDQVVTAVSQLLNGGP